MRRNRLYALAVLMTVAVVAGPAIAATVQSHAAKRKPAVKVGPRGRPGRRGARGPSGPTGPTGPPGTSGASFLRTIVVSPSGATAAANGALLAGAVAAISGAAATNTYLVWIEPGVYDLGTTPLNIPAHVDVQGSGQDVTTIEGEGLLTLAAASGNTEVRGLTVTDTNGHRQRRGDRHERRPARRHGHGQRHDRRHGGARERADDADRRRHRVGDDIGVLQLGPRDRHAGHGADRRRQLQRVRQRVLEPGGRALRGVVDHVE